MLRFGYDASAGRTGVIEGTDHVAEARGIEVVFLSVKRGVEQVLTRPRTASV